MEDKSREKSEKSVNVYAALGVGFVCIVIGLPLWWKTTTVYRVNLPYAEIEQLGVTRFVARVNVKVAVYNDEVIAKLPVFTDKVEQYLEGLDILDKKLAIEYKTRVRKASEAEHKAVEAQKSFTVFDQLAANSTDSCVVVILPMTWPKLSSFPENRLVVGEHLMSYMHADSDLDVMAKRISELVRNVYSNEKSLLSALKHAQGATHQQTDKATMRSVRTHAAYDLTFTLLNPQPDMLRARWDMHSAEKIFLEPMIKKLENYASIEVKSQYLYKLPLGVRPRKDAESGISTLQESDLPHIINPVEAYLGSHVSNNPNLNFLVYLPSRDQSPLHILHSSGMPSKSNTFLSPRWGSFMVYNVDVPENSSVPFTHHVHMQAVMRAFMPHIKLLLGIKTPKTLPDAEFLPSVENFITDWELASWLRSGCVENAMSSVVTLTSLADLLQKINNIVINDVIGRQVEKAVRYVKKCREELGAGDLERAYLSSLQAIQASEKAFFDPSLLELLYFPEDQKFAIYIPLFLPIGIPIVMSILQAVKYLTKKEDLTKTKAE